MSYSLTITVKKDPEKDIEEIKARFFGAGNEHFKKRILNFYKTLATEINNSSDEETLKVVEDFFRNLYQKREVEIDKIIGQSRSIIEEKSPSCLNQLVRLMNYEIKQNEEFIATPTLLPFSPFNRPMFYFSITPSLFLSKESDILGIAIHEISHFLFFDILKDLNIKLDHNLEEKNFFHLFKETLTGMLLSEKELAEILERKDYKGNPEVHNLYIKESTSGNETTLREYLRENLHTYQQKGLPFSVFIKEMIERLLPKATDFSDKKIFWNKNEQELRKDDSMLLKEYAQPISI